jgi:hypothetical protein
MTYSTAANAPQNLVELSLERVKEIIELNAKGIKPEGLLEQIEPAKAEPLDFASSIVEGSLTRFDKK